MKEGENKTLKTEMEKKTEGKEEHNRLRKEKEEQ